MHSPFPSCPLSSPFCPFLNVNGPLNPTVGSSLLPTTTITQVKFYLQTRPLYQWFLYLLKIFLLFAVTELNLEPKKARLHRASNRHTSLTTATSVLPRPRTSTNDPFWKRENRPFMCVPKLPFLILYKVLKSVEVPLRKKHRLKTHFPNSLYLGPFILVTEDPRIGRRRDLCLLLRLRTYTGRNGPRMDPSASTLSKVISHKIYKYLLNKRILIEFWKQVSFPLT